MPLYSPLSYLNCIFELRVSTMFLIPPTFVFCAYVIVESINKKNVKCQKNICDFVILNLRNSVIVLSNVCNSVVFDCTISVVFNERSIYLSICLSVCLSVCLSICDIYVSIYRSIEKVPGKVSYVSLFT